ncbi:molybdenum cofactor cytidylyltransferase [Pseudocitrobacter cyperus]|uniref:Molybdenum cofactor cytidylyltransferase n=1 Tax=Pseudocitrobacter cyperus TaxID=3112843 RepID=A0ABV0HJB4_9ENTR
MPKIDCIMTAAGLSSRMGQWKMMLPWREGTILDTSIKNALQFCSRIILVTGYRANELHSRYANHKDIVIVHNPDYAQGLFSSIKVAAPVVESEYCFITHGDMPCLNKKIFNDIWNLKRNGALLPHFKGIPGHPILLSKSCLMQAVSQSHAASMRQALLTGIHYSVALDDASIILDIDTPDDFKRISKM